MRLLLYEKFLDSYSNLPKEIQKKVMNFVQKFKTDSTVHSINLEPIVSFKDQSLRTARIDLKYRAIIHVPNSGDYCHLLWVDNHDEAMAWAENKVFQWNEQTQTHQVYEYTEPKKAESEDADRETFCNQFRDEQLLSIGVPYPLLPSVKMINNLDDLEALEKYIPQQAFENLYYLLDGINIDEVIYEIEQGKIKEDDQTSQVDSANNQRAFFEIKDDTDVEEFLSGDLSKWKIFLHPSQRNLVNKNYNGSYKVTGAAGTGKTVVAMHRLKKLCPETNRSNSILFTTFTKSLVKNLKELIRTLGVDLNKVVINNVHRFIVENAKELSLIEPDAKIVEFEDKKYKENIWKEVVEYMLSEFDIDFLIREYEEVILFHNVKIKEEYLSVPRIGMEIPMGRRDRLKVWDLMEYFMDIKNASKIYYLDEITNLLTDYYSKNPEKPFEYIIADEIQDFSDVELRLLRSMTAEKPNDLFLVGDPLQKIYSRNLNFSRSGINIRGRKSTRLKFNYRTTEEIKRSAVSVIKEIAYDNFDGGDESKSGYISIMHGEKPSYEILKSTAEMNESLFSKIEVLIKSEDLSFNEICIGSRTNRTLNEVKKYLHSQKIPYYDLPHGVGDKAGVMLSTFHNMKGLEFKSVILYDVSENTVPHKFHTFDSLTESEKQNYIKSERALLYVAMTRAIKYLSIIGVGNASKFID